ncbi:MAG: heavy metal translocating P-type ATPase [Phycisphaeraceae bacterium]
MNTTLTQPGYVSQATVQPSPCACTHCGLPVPQGLVVPGQANQFCCQGCASAYEIIHGCGLDAYYRLREQSESNPQPRQAADQDRLAVFDTAKFHELYVRRRYDGTHVVDLMLEGVHCAACIWLIEKLPRVVPGVIEARLSLSSRTVRIVWEPERVALSEIAKKLSSLGYIPHPARGSDASGIQLAEQRAMLIRLGVSGAIAGNTMLLAFALYTGMFGGMEQRFADFFRWISAVLGVLSLAWPGRVFFKGALAALRTRTPHLDVPIALALGVGGLAGTINVVLGRGEIYFDSLTVLVFLLLVGRFIQYRQQRRADEAVGLLLSLTPTNSRRVTTNAYGESIETIPIEAVEVGDVLEVRSGELVPADGRVEQGRASVIAALITGESRPVPIDEGDLVCAGSRLSGATIRLRVSAVGESSRVGQLLSLVQQGMADKPPVVAVTDRVAGWFVCVVSLLALAVFSVWSLFDLALAVDHTVALLIIACPCALGLATPLSLSVAIGRSAKRDILIKSAAALDRLARPGQIWIDKTGTITRGQMCVVAWSGDTALQPIVAEVERHATHPIARAIVEAYAEQEPAAADRVAVEEVQVEPSGIAAKTAMGPLLIGSRQYLADRGVVTPAQQEHDAVDCMDRSHTSVFVALRREIVAKLTIGDAIYDDARASLKQLRQWGWEVRMLTGDEQAVADAVGHAVGLNTGQIDAGVTPEEKLAATRRSTVNDRAVVMVGDGVNDAAALAAADVGIAVSGGAEASMAAADIYLAKPGLSGLVDLIATARNTRRVIRRNLVVSFAYNAIGITLAALGLINPLVAAVLMPASSALVLALAMHGQCIHQTHKDLPHDQAVEASR